MASHISAAAWAWTSVLPSEQYDRWTPNENRKHLLTKLPPRASKSKCQIWRRPGHATSAPGCQYPMHERQAAGSSETDPHSLLQLLTNTIPAPVTSLSIRVLHPSPWPHRSASAPHASICPNAKRPQPRPHRSASPSCTLAAMLKLQSAPPCTRATPEQSRVAAPCCRAHGW